MAATAHYNTANHTVVVRATLFLYGSEASEHAGEQIISEITHMYNEPQAHLPINGVPALVVFEVDYKLFSIEDTFALLRINRDHRNNFIRLGRVNTLTRSFMGFGLGDNTGHWITSDQLGVSTTAAHEFGHGLGLPHPQRTDFRGFDTPPPIMAPRGSLVDRKFQWNPEARPGEFGGTMNPKYRKVTQNEILAALAGIPFDISHFDYAIGMLTNTFYNETGDPLERLS